jgi:hypothetical protein
MSYSKFGLVALIQSSIASKKITTDDLIDIGEVFRYDAFHICLSGELNNRFQSFKRVCCFSCISSKPLSYIKSLFTSKLARTGKLTATMYRTYASNSLTHFVYHDISITTANVTRDICEICKTNKLWSKMNKHDLYSITIAREELLTQFFSWETRRELKVYVNLALFFKDINPSSVNFSGNIPLNLREQTRRKLERKFAPGIISEILIKQHSLCTALVTAMSFYNILPSDLDIDIDTLNYPFNADMTTKEGEKQTREDWTPHPENPSSIQLKHEAIESCFSDDETEQPL